MSYRAPDRPWEPARTRLCLRGRVLLRVAPGEAPARIPHYLDVARRRATAPLHFDGGAVDRVLRRFSPGTRISRAYRCAHGGLDAQGEQRWDEVEHSTGLSRTFRIEVDPEVRVLDLAAELASLTRVELCTPHYLAVTPFQRLRDGEDEGLESIAPPRDRYYAHRMVKSKMALEFEPGDRTLILGVVDSGVDLDHHELRGKLRPGIDTVDLDGPINEGDVTLIGDLRDPDRIARDGMGHGTACASIVGARGHRLPRGVAGAARVLPARALASARVAGGAKLTALGGLADIDAAVKTAVDLGARVLNLSFGTPEGALREEDPEPHAEIVAYARERGCILVAASGNDGLATRYYPAAHPGVIAVGSVGESARPSHFSTRGDHVALCAPGEQVASASVGSYQGNTGTSFAAPFVAGACALLVARAARYGRPLEPDDAKRLLSASTRPFAGTETGGCGTGILDIPSALRALERALNPSNHATPPTEAESKQNV